jgi:hypothetical protein
MTWEECVKFLIEHHYQQTSSRNENQMYQGSTAGRTLRKGNLEVEVVFKENLDPVLICRIVKPNPNDYFYCESIMCTDKN